jgi:hypothetical protein
MSVTPGFIAFIGYVTPTQIVVVTVPSKDQITDCGIDLHDATLYTGQQDELLLPEATTHSAKELDAIFNLPAWKTFEQDLTLASQVKLVQSYCAMIRVPLHYYWAKDGKRTPIRPLDRKHFNVETTDEGLRVTSKPRQVVYAGADEHRTVAITMVGYDRTSAEFFHAKSGEQTACRMVVDHLAIDHDDRHFYVLHMRGQDFAFLDGQGRFQGPKTAIDDVSGFRLDQRQGLITFD